MFTQAAKEAISGAAREFGLEPAALLAVAEVESGGAVFALVDGRQEPLIRFEGHYFDRRLSGEALAKARKAGLASPTAGAVANPAQQAARWGLLEKAAAIDRKAAYESVSWGLGQVMGAHWSWLGFANVEALVAEARSGAAGQARLMARFIDGAGLKTALTSRDWESFARGYNGPGFRKNGYHTKLAAAYRRQAGSEGAVRVDATGSLLKNGARGEPVRDLQQALAALGYPLADDGLFGTRTQAAVEAFQRDHGLAVDGIAGPLTRDAIAKALPFGAAWWQTLVSWLGSRFASLGNAS